MRLRSARFAFAAAMLAASCHVAMAAGSGMPWEAPLQRILESIEGPVAKVVAVVTIILTGLSLSFGDMGGAFRRMVQVVSGSPSPSPPPRSSCRPSPSPAAPSSTE
jgi:type IV secretion system protein VirB2